MQFSLAEVVVVLMAIIGPYKIFDNDIAHLAPGRALESEIQYSCRGMRRRQDVSADKSLLISPGRQIQNLIQKQNKGRQWSNFGKQSYQRENRSK